MRTILQHPRTFDYANDDRNNGSQLWGGGCHLRSATVPLKALPDGFQASC